MNELVIKCRRAGLLDDALQNCPYMRMCVRFAPEPTVIKSVIKRWRAELLEVVLQNCMSGGFALEPAFSYLCY